MFLHLQNAIHVTLYIIRRAFISSSSKKTMYTKMSSVHGSSVLTVRSCLGLPILATSYCAYSDPFPTGLFKCPYSFLLGQGNGLKYTKPPPHREKQRPKCNNPSPLWEGNAKK